MARQQNLAQVLQERCSGQEAAFAATRGAFKGVAVAMKQQFQRPGVLQNRCNGHESAMARQQSPAQELQEHCSGQEAALISYLI